MLFAGAAFGATGIVQGNVKGPDGKPVKDAQITISLKDSKGGSSAKTDAKGHYSFKDLAPGSYSVNVRASGLATTSVTDVKPRTDGAVRVDFALKTQTGNAGQAPVKAKKKATHMVYIPSQTGSNLGGRWVEVDDQGSAPGTENVQRAGGGTVKSIQSNSGGKSLGGN